MLTSAEVAIISDVRRLYEAHPYPRYPLLARPLWQEGYIGRSYWSRALARCQYPDLGPLPAPFPRVLVAGCGEIQPFAMRHLEGLGTTLSCVDLSRVSLSRARVRLGLMSLWRTNWIRSDLGEWLAEVKADSFDHVDAFGVLHHLPNPRRAMNDLARVMSPGATARWMIYNSHARGFLRHLQRAFALLRIDYRRVRDVAFARTLLEDLASDHAVLRNRLQGMGRGTLTNDARFVDTFLHVREARVDLCAWIEAAKESGLTPLGLLDRYDELNDLPNPLYSFPNPSMLQARCRNGVMGGNFEIFWIKDPTVRAGVVRRRPSHAVAMDSLTWARWSLRRAPRSWAACLGEGRVRSLVLAQRLWADHGRWILGLGGVVSHDILRNISDDALVRLGRLGAVFPSQIADLKRRALLYQPLGYMEQAAAKANDGYAEVVVSCHLAQRVSERLEQLQVRGTSSRATLRRWAVLQRLARACT